jgi:hypothetical protein
VRGPSVADESLAALKAQIADLVVQNRKLPDPERSEELRALLDHLIQEGRKLGWDAERSLLLARTLEVDHQGSQGTASKPCKT